MSDFVESLAVIFGPPIKRSDPKCAVAQGQNQPQ